MPKALASAQLQSVSPSYTSNMSPSLQSHTSSKHLSRGIDNGSLIIRDMIGVGAYGSVYKALDIESGELRAIKCLRISGLDSRQRAFQNQETELHTLVSGHPNIATLHKVVEEDECLYMVLDCGVEGDLFYKITERGGYVGNDPAIKSIFGQIASAVMHCHSKGIYHRDLKPENIIMFGECAKLVDFGLATTEPFSSEFGCGSTFYLSPECQGGYVEPVKSYDSAANDVWSLGVILVNLVFGRNPWKQACTRDETFAAYVLNNNFLQTILPMSDELNKIIKDVFCLNPRKRISLLELVLRVQSCRSFTTTDIYRSSTSSSASAATTATTAVDAVTPHSDVTAAPIESFFVPQDKFYGAYEKDQAQSQSQDSGIDIHSMA